MKRLLKLKNGQFFLTLVGLPFLLIIIGGSLAKITNEKAFLSILPMMSGLIMMFTYFGWIWSIGVLLPKEFFPNEKKISSTFKLVFRLALLLFITIPILDFYHMDSSRLIIKTLRFISLILFLYSIYLTTVRLKDIERLKWNQINNQFGDFFLIWILPIGIWFIQPRINRLISEDKEESRVGKGEFHP